MITFFTPGALLPDHGRGVSDSSGGICPGGGAIQGGCGGPSFLFVATFAAFTVALAIYHSWANDFQAQGRYLFPIVAMLGIGLQSMRDKMDPRVAKALSPVTPGSLGMWRSRSYALAS